MRKPLAHCKKSSKPCHPRAQVKTHSAERSAINCMGPETSTNKRRDRKCSLATDQPLIQGKNLVPLGRRGRDAKKAQFPEPRQIQPMQEGGWNKTT
jgi:hypothetical protein